MLKRYQEGFLAPLPGRYTQKSTYQVPITYPYLPHYIICHLPLVFLSPQFTLDVLFALSLYPPSLFASFARLLLFARVLDCLLVVMAQDTTKLCDFTNTNNNDFLSTPIAPLNDAESYEIILLC